MSDPIDGIEVIEDDGDEVLKVPLTREGVEMLATALMAVVNEKEER